LRPDAPAPPSRTRSVGEIVGDMSTLIRQEMDLAKTEMKQEVSNLGTAAGLFGGFKEANPQLPMTQQRLKEDAQMGSRQRR